MTESSDAPHGKGLIFQPLCPTCGGKIKSKEDVSAQPCVGLPLERTSGYLREFFDKAAEQSPGDHAWKVGTGLLAVYQLGRLDAESERDSRS